MCGSGYGARIIISPRRESRSNIQCPQEKVEYIKDASEAFWIGDYIDI